MSDLVVLPQTVWACIQDKQNDLTATAVCVDTMSSITTKPDAPNDVGI